MSEKTVAHAAYAAYAAPTLPGPPLLSATVAAGPVSLKRTMWSFQGDVAPIGASLSGSKDESGNHKLCVCVCA
jgi:hypothetical protein